MPLETLDRTPPPFFRQGLPAWARLGVLSGLAVLLMLADARWRVAEPLRLTLSTALLPLEHAAALPVQAWHHAGAYFGSLREAQAAEDAARESLVRLVARADQADRLAAENARLRALLELRPSLTIRSVPAEVLRESADLFSRRVVIDRGRTHGVMSGAPVIDDRGVLGQVTRVFPLNAEVTLLTDRDAAIPVLNTRTGVRGAAFGGVDGGANPGMEWRYVAADADIQEGDLLTTSGLDGVYPPGLPVARVTSIERRAESGFARVRLTPAAPADRVRHVLVLEPVSAQWPDDLPTARPAESVMQPPASPATDTPQGPR
ncbi:MAG: rod shape-determining protein MreC [Rubrivivax sp.]